LPYNEGAAAFRPTYEVNEVQMRIHPATFTALALIGGAVLTTAIVKAQAPAGGRAAVATAAVQSQGTLLQVMRGILFPNSNIFFSAQAADPTTVEKDADPTSSVNPLASTYGGWQAIENSSIALAESANLLTVPGRVCGNGKPVPVQNADWQRFVQGLRDGGMAAYKAAQSKDMDKIVDAADVVTTACSDCHDVYREKSEKQGGDAARCTK
jgi:cytochrome c556